MVYYQNLANQEVYGYDPATQQDLINQAVAAGWTLLTTWPLPPTNDQLMAACKQTASSLLYQTDWTTIPDVASPENTPYLTNQDQFIAYRNIIRGYAVNPVPNPEWPVQPIPQWSA